MFPKITDETIKEQGNLYPVKTGGEIYARTIYNEGVQGKTALFIHGGGSGGNHSMLIRPSRWFIHKDLFSQIILPDKRGSGYSSPLTEKVTHLDNAKDMMSLLDSMNINEPVTAIGVSYGGPAALTLASIDPRVDEVILIASSPSIKSAKGLAGFLHKIGLLEPIVRFAYKKIIGKLEPEYVDYDCTYDINNIKELKKIFIEKMRHIEKDRLESLIIENSSTLDKNNTGIPRDVQLTIPVYQIIGSKDEVWEVNIRKTYPNQLLHFTEALIPGASHKDVFTRAEEFYQTAYEIVAKGRTP